jgi:hypothetical protein
MSHMSQSQYQIVCFDIGIRNLAWSIVNVDQSNVEIAHLEVSDLNCKKQETQKIIDATLNVLDEIYQKMNLTIPIVILIESQMTSVMRMVQTVINTFFKMHARYQSLSLTTKYISPKLKLALTEVFKDQYVLPSVTAASSYRQNKIDSVHFGSWLLMSSKYKNERILRQILSMKKRDDAFDCLLPCFHYLEIETKKKSKR